MNSMRMREEKLVKTFEEKWKHNRMEQHGIYLTHITRIKSSIWFEHIKQIEKKKH